MTRSRLADIVTSTLFLAAITLPLAGLTLRLLNINSLNDITTRTIGTTQQENRHIAEQRTLSPRPALPDTLTALKQFPAALERFANDHFGFREVLLDLQATIAYTVFHRSGSPHVLAGKEDWLFYTQDGLLEDMQGASAFSSADIHAWITYIEQRATWLAANNVAYRFLIAPDKYTIHPEMLPNSARNNAPSRLQGLMAVLDTTGAAAHVVMPHAALIARKASTSLPLYFHTDTHWTPFGAYVAYRELMASLGGYLHADALQLDDTAFTPQPNPSATDLSVMIRHPYREPLSAADLSQPQQCLRDATASPPAGADMRGIKAYAATRCEGKTGTALVLHDSFMTALAPYLATQFGRVVYIWGQPSAETMRLAVRQEQPDVLIEERVERHMRVAPSINGPRTPEPAMAARTSSTQSTPL
jgi:hypothetical protein